MCPHTRPLPQGAPALPLDFGAQPSEDPPRGEHAVQRPAAGRSARLLGSRLCIINGLKAERAARKGQRRGGPGSDRAPGRGPRPAEQLCPRRTLQRSFQKVPGPGGGSVRVRRRVPHTHTAAGGVGPCATRGPCAPTGTAVSEAEWAGFWTRRSGVTRGEAGQGRTETVPENGEKEAAERCVSALEPSSLAGAWRWGGGSERSVP